MIQSVKKEDAVMKKLLCFFMIVLGSVHQKTKAEALSDLAQALQNICKHSDEELQNIAWDFVSDGFKDEVARSFHQALQCPLNQQWFEEHINDSIRTRIQSSQSLLFTAVEIEDEDLVKNILNISTLDPNEGFSELGRTRSPLYEALIRLKNNPYYDESKVKLKNIGKMLYMHPKINVSKGVKIVLSPSMLEDDIEHDANQTITQFLDQNPDVKKLLQNDIITKNQLKDVGFNFQ